MSCWVVPTIAAELWGVSVDHVLERIRDGNLPHRTEEGFMFVDVAPDGGGCSPTVHRERPPTFTALSEAEIEALREGEEAIDEVGPPAEDDEEASVDVADWRAARQRVSVTRVPPPRARTQAA